MTLFSTHSPLQQNFAKDLSVLCVSYFFSPTVQTGFAPPHPCTTLSQSLWSPMTLMLLNPAVNSQSSSYLASQHLVTVDHFLLPETFFHLGSWDITGSWFSSYFLHWSAPQVPSNISFVSTQKRSHSADGFKHCRSLMAHALRCPA